jgi:hypothetical protein
MPTLKFQLRNPRLVLDAKPGHEEWRLIFEATSQPVRDGDSFKILLRGKRYDAFCTSGTVYISPRANLPDQPSPERTDGAVCSLAVVYSPEDWGDTAPFFEVKVSVNADSFHRLIQTPTHVRATELWVSTVMGEDGLIYGNDPDGRELEWWVEKSNLADAESISIRFISG